MNETMRPSPYHHTAVLRAAGYDVVVMGTELNVQHGPCVATHRGVGHVNTSRLQRERETETETERERETETETDRDREFL